MEQIKLDIVPVGVAPVAHASQFDNGRQIRFNLFNQGTPYTLTGAETVTMVVNGEEENITNTSDNYVIWDVAEEDCAEVGVIGCEIRIVLGSMLIGSKNFFLEVEMDPYDGQNIHVVTVGPADICTFETTLPEPYQSVLVNVLATGGNGTPDNPNPINGYTEANIVNTQNESIVDLFSIDSDFRGIVAFNQLCPIPTNSNTQTLNSVTMTDNRDGSYTFGGTATADCIFQVISQKSWQAHKYILVGGASNGSATKYSLAMRGAGGDCFDFGNGNVWNATGNTWKGIVIYIKNGQDTNGLIFKPQLIDLTQMFGSTIADYIYGLERATAGAGVAFFRSIYPADYYDYDSGTNELVGKETPEVTIAFGQTVYGGVLDVTRGKLTVTHNIIDMGSINWNKLVISQSVTGYQTASAPTGIKLNKDNNTVPDILCEVFEADTVNHGYTGENPECITENTIGLVTVYTQTAYADGSAFKTAMTGMEFTYPLATPVEIDLTPEVISAVVGTNNVFADCGETTVKYLKAGA